MEEMKKKRVYWYFKNQNQEKGFLVKLLTKKGRKILKKELAVKQRKRKN